MTTATAAQQQLVRKANATIRATCTYGELEELAGVTDRIAFWAPFHTDEAAARRELHRLAFARLTATFH